MQNNHLPTKVELWKKYPELPRLWSEYQRVCRNPTSQVEVSRAFESYRIAYCGHRDRYQITPDLTDEDIIRARLARMDLVDRGILPVAGGRS